MKYTVTPIHGSNCPDILITKETYRDNFTERQKELVALTGKAARNFIYIYETGCGTYFTWGAEINTSLRRWNQVFKVEKLSKFTYITFKGM